MLDQILGDIPTPLKFVIAFAVIILLLVLAVWIGRRFGANRFGPTAGATGRSRQPRLGVLDVLAVDGRRRLVIVRRDNVEHLVMIGGPNDIVVESGILRVPAGMPAQRDAPALQPPDPAPARTAPPQPVPGGPRVPSPAGPMAPAADRGQPERPQPERSQPDRSQPDRSQPKTVDAPPIVPGQARAPTSQGTPVRPVAPPQAAQARPAAPAPQTDAQLRPAAPAPQPQRPAPAVEPPKPADESAPRPAAPVAPSAPRPAPPQQIIAGPAGRTPEAPRGGAQRAPAPTMRSADLAERLAAALKRPVQPAPQAAAPIPQPPAAAADVAPPPAPAPAAPKPQPAEAAADDLPREMPAMSDEAAPAPKPPAAPEVKAEARPAPAKAPAQDDDPLASLEAEMANLLGRDVGRKS